MLTDVERAQMVQEVPVILARYKVRDEDLQGLTDDLTGWLEACIVATGMFEYGRGQRSVLAPR